MADFDLDLRNAEEQLDDEEDYNGTIVLGILDSAEDSEEWLANVEDGNVLVLAIQGDLNRLASGFARDIKEMGGQLMHFRKFLIVTPPGVGIDTDRL
ncbi:MAG: DUF5779 family protein [Halobacteriota archaeon]